MTRVLLRRRGEERGFELFCELETGREGDSADGTGLAVVLPAGSDKVPPRDALEIHALGLADEDGPVLELGIIAEGFWKVKVIVLDDMVLDRFQVLEPQVRDLVQDDPLPGNAVWKDMVKRRYPVGGHDEQVLLVHGVKVADLAAVFFPQAGYFDVNQWFHSTAPVFNGKPYASSVAID